MKTLVFAFFSMLLVFGTAHTEKTRVSLMFVHYSVGNRIVYSGYCNNGYNRPISETLDTTIVNFGNDTARIVFRDYNMNLEESGPLSDTVFSCETGPVRLSNFNYDLVSSHYNRMKIWNSWNGVTDQFAGLLKEFFEVPDKENQRFWTIFKQHNVPGVSGDSVSEFYDLVMVKNPYFCWSYMTQARADSIKKFYKAVRDSVVNHPEIKMCLVFGTPRLLYDTVDDSAQAKITYELASWFASDSFFTHDNTGIYKNIWKYDSYRFLCEMSPDSVNRYCLKNEYATAPGDSHISFAAARISQDSLIAFIKGAVADILIQKTPSDSCSCQNRGNVDGLVGPDGPIDIADVSYLISYLFNGGNPPLCKEEANVDGVTNLNNQVDVGDLSYLVEYLYAEGPTPPPCE